MPLSFEDILTPVGPPDGMPGGPSAFPSGRPCARASAVAAAALMAFAGCATTGASGPEDASGAQGRLRLPPVVWWDRNPDGSHEVRNFLGFLYGQRAGSGTLREGRVVSRKSLHVLWPIYHGSSTVEADGMRTTRRSLMPFVWVSRKSEPSGKGTDYVRRRVTIPLLLFSLRSDNYGSGQIEYEFLWPLGKYFRGERLSGGSREMIRSFVFRPFVRCERTWPLAMGARESGMSAAGAGPEGLSGASGAASRPGEIVRLRVLNPIFGYERHEDPRRKRAFFLGGIVGGGEGKERILGFVAAEKGPATDYEFQALWQFFMAKRWGSEEVSSHAFAEEKPSDMWRAVKWLFCGSPRKEFKLGPVVDYESDWSGDRKEFSMLFGLVSYAREGDRRYGRFLWIIPWGP